MGHINSRGWLGFAGLILVASFNQACGSAHSDSDESVSEVAPPETLVDKYGRDWVRSATPVVYAPEEQPNGDVTTELPPQVPLEEMPLDELAERIRPRTVINGYEYELASPDYETAAKILSGDGVGAFSTSNYGAMGAPDSDVPEEERDGQNIFDNDTRSIKRNNSSFPWRTIISLTPGTCTATLIGPSTAVTAAHCVHNGSSWLSTRGWAPGVDNQDSNPFTYNPWTADPTYPHYDGLRIQGCYVVTVPGGWNSDKDVADDYAVFEFSDMFPAIPNCNLFPGSTVGWFGFWAASASTVEGHDYLYAYGYPGESEGCPGGPCFTPTIWGSGNSNFSVESSHIEHHTDTTAGMSGSGLYVITGSNSDRRIVGIHKGGHDCWWCSDYNHGRRVTSGILNFVEANSAYRREF